MHKGPGSPLRRISRAERRYDQSRASLKIPAGSPISKVFLCASGKKNIPSMSHGQQEVIVPLPHVGNIHLPRCLSFFSLSLFCRSPSGEKKNLEPKPSGDMNGYQIRVWEVGEPSRSVTRFNEVPLLVPVHRHWLVHRARRWIGHQQLLLLRTNTSFSLTPLEAFPGAALWIVTTAGRLH